MAVRARLLQPRFGGSGETGDPAAAIITAEFEKENVLTRTAVSMQGLIPVVIDHPVYFLGRAWQR
jgi:hypothetical protein